MKIKIAGVPVSWTMGKDQPEVGQKLPDFTVKNEKGQNVTPKDFLGKMTLLSVVPNLKTKTCSLETKHFNETASNFKNIRFVTISNNSVAEQKDWCAAKGVDNIEMLSDEDGSFGKAMHLHIPVFNHLARVVFLVDADGKIVYRQVVPEITNQPNYETIIKALDQITNEK